MEYIFQYQFMQYDYVNHTQGGMNFRQVTSLVFEDMPDVAAFLVKAKGMLFPREICPDIKIIFYRLNFKIFGRRRLNLGTVLKGGESGGW
jgi:hypothetical protein